VNEQHDPRIVEALVRVESMSQDIAEIKAATQKISEAMVTLARIEERQAQDRDQIGRLFKLSDGHEDRIRTLEDAQPLQRQASKWMQHAVSIIVTAVITAVVSTVVVHSNVDAHKADVPQLSMPAK
jgi:hypothetical protein